MVPYDYFLPDVLPFATDCADFVATHQVRNAAIEFAELTDFSRFEHPEIVLVSGIGDYDLDLPDDTSASRLLRAYSGRNLLIASNEDHLADRYGSDWRALTGGAAFILQTDPSAIRLVPVPDDANIGEAANLNLILSLRPTRASTQCDDAFYEHFAETIAAGALSRLYLTKGQSYSDPANAGAMRMRFLEGVTRAKLLRSRSFGRPILSMRPARSAL